MRRLLVAALAVGLLSAACSDGDDDVAAYLSLGDSIAVGWSASDPPNNGFVALVAGQEDAELRNLAVAGATTADVIDHQLADAVSLVESGGAAFVTVSAGVNDLADLIPNGTCAEDPLPASCPLEVTLADVEERLLRIVDDIRDADDEVPIVLLAYPNFFSGTGHPWEASAARVLPRLAEAMRGIADEYGRVAVAEPSFEGRGGELTHVLDEPFDPHPNDAGHRIIADAVVEALATVE